ncbi:MAG: hypothetical protein QM730_24725 [Anaerolineales bacterium]
MKLTHYWYGLYKVLLACLLVGLSAACGRLIPVTGAMTGNIVTLDNCYKVQFLGTSHEEQFVSTWKYRVEELGCGKDLRVWMLEIPACATVLEAGPVPWEAIQSDLTFQASGIQWRKEADFHGGDFNVKLSGPITRGTIRIGAQGTNVFTGFIQGPICDLTLNMPTTTFTAANIPTATQTATVPLIHRDTTDTDVPIHQPTSIPKDAPASPLPLPSATSISTIENTPLPPAQEATTTPVKTPKPAKTHPPKPTKHPTKP